ncbi:MAG: ABC transporter ATP-binding protein [Acidobacteriia bacterium]|nr:ABC transporter ATP-binding protein [Terriglobia bacterium]
MICVRAEHLAKSYRIYPKPSARLQELLTFNRISRHHDFWALDDVSFEAEEGQTVGIIGVNGSGKSTLLQLIAGILQPSRGSVTARGRISALLELGSGFNLEFTGRENVFINGALLGLRPGEIEARMSAIEQFAEIGEFFDQAVKTYSSGMFVRLAFAVAINVDPDILIVDEALAVGDAIFQHRCMRKILELRKNGKTIFLVSHDNSAVKKLCDEVLLLDAGKLLGKGNADSMVQKYLELTYAREKRYSNGGSSETAASGPERRNFFDSSQEHLIMGIPNVDHRFGDGRAEVLGIEVFGEEGIPKRSFAPQERIRVKISTRFRESLVQPIVGFILRDRLGIDLMATNTEYEEAPLGSVETGEIRTVEFSLQLPFLRQGNYSLCPAVADGTASHHVMCDWIDNAVVFSVESGELIHGLMRLKIETRVF